MRWRRRLIRRQQARIRNCAHDFCFLRERCLICGVARYDLEENDKLVTRRAGANRDRLSGVRARYAAGLITDSVELTRALREEFGLPEVGQVVASADTLAGILAEWAERDADWQTRKKEFEANYERDPTKEQVPAGAGYTFVWMRPKQSAS